MPTILPPATAETIPNKLSGKEFEKKLVDAANRQSAHLTMGRYGTEVRWIRGQQKAVKSLPDFEGIRHGGKQFIVEAKAVSGSALPLSDDHFKDRQYKHMAERALYGAECYLIIHFNRREIGNSGRFEPPVTYRIPVDASTPLWAAFESGALKSINRETAATHGVAVEWTIPPRKQIALPDFLGITLPQHT